MLFSCLRIAILRRQNAQLILGYCKVGVDLNRFLESTLLPGKIPRQIECRRQFVIQLRIIRSCFKRLAVKTNGLLRVPGAHLLVCLRDLACGKGLILSPSKLLLIVIHLLIGRSSVAHNP